MWLPSTTSLPGLSASRDKQISWHKLTADEMAFHRSCRAQYRSREDPRYAGIRSVAPWNVVASGASAAVATEWRSRVAGGSQRHGVSARGRRRRRECVAAYACVRSSAAAGGASARVLPRSVRVLNAPGKSATRCAPHATAIRTWSVDASTTVQALAFHSTLSLGSWRGSSTTTTAAAHWSGRLGR